MAPAGNTGQDPDNRGRMTVAGLEVAAGAGIGAAIGYWIDHKWHCDPWGVLIGTFVGIASGMYLLIKEAIRANKD